MDYIILAEMGRWDVLFTSSRRNCSIEKSICSSSNRFFLVGKFLNASLGCEPVRIPNQPAAVNTAGIQY